MEQNIQKTMTFMTFTGQAEEAMNLYTSLFDQSQIINILHHENGKVLHATFTIKNQMYMCIDSTVQHEWSFTPAISIFVVCDTAEEIDKLFEGLSDGGKVYMPLAASPFSEKFAWVEDRYGVSWQLNLPKQL